MSIKFILFMVMPFGFLITCTKEFYSIVSNLSEEFVQIENIDTDFNFFYLFECLKIYNIIIRRTI